MAIDTDFRAAMLAHAPLVALIDDRLSLNVAPDTDVLPIVVFSVRTDRTLGLNGSVHGERAAIDVQVWADSAAAARTVADELIAAVATVPDKAVVTDHRDTYEPDLKIDGVLLTVVWFD